MSRHSIMTGCNPADVVNRYIGTAYDTVKFVADNMDRLDEIYDIIVEYGNYLGVHDDTPLFRGSKNPVQVGDFYFNTTNNSFGFIVEVEVDDTVDPIVVTATTYFLDINYLASLAEQAENSAEAAALSKDEAAASATEADLSKAQSATSAQEAATSANEAKDSADSILNLTASAVSTEPGSQPTASYDPVTGVLTIGIPDANVTLNNTLTSTSTDEALAANQGRVLNESINTEKNRINDVQSLVGVSDGETDLGTFTGSVISDNADVKTALQEVETKLDEVSETNVTLYDGLDSTSTTEGLTANQGKVLDEKIDNSVQTLDDKIEAKQAEKYLIGEAINFMGSASDIPYIGEWHNTSTPKIFHIDDYPDFVPLNRDVLDETEVINPLVASGRSDSIHAATNPTRIIDGDDSGYLLLQSVSTTLGGITEYVHIVSSKYSNESGQEIKIRRIRDSYYYNEVGKNPTDTTTISGGTQPDSGVISDIAVDVVDADGDSYKALVQVLYRTDSRETYRHFVVKLHEITPNNISSYTPPTGDATKINHVNKYTQSDIIVGNNIVDIKFSDNYFLIYRAGETLPTRYSYDFSGGTLKQEVDTNTYANLTNNNVSNYSMVQSACTFIGPETKDIYQIDRETLEIYINGVMVHDASFGVDLTTVDYSEPGSKLCVYENNGKIFVMFIDSTNVSNGRLIQCHAYFDGTDWHTITIPTPFQYPLEERTEPYFMGLCKFDINTGLAIAYLGGDRGGKISYSDSHKGEVFMISLDYGVTWFEDDSVTYSSSFSTANRTCRLSDVFPAGYYLNYANKDSNNEINRQCYGSYVFNDSIIFDTNTSQFITGYSYPAKFEWVYPVPLDTLTITGSASGKIKEYVRVK